MSEDLFILSLISLIILSLACIIFIVLEIRNKHE